MMTLRPSSCASGPLLQSSGRKNGYMPMARALSAAMNFWHLSKTSLPPMRERLVRCAMSRARPCCALVTVCVAPPPALAAAGAGALAAYAAAPFTCAAPFVFAGAAAGLFEPSASASPSSAGSMLGIAWPLTRISHASRARSLAALSRPRASITPVATRITLSFPTRRTNAPDVAIRLPPATSRSFMPMVIVSSRSVAPGASCA